MPGWEALNFSATCCSTATWSGASPVPRQQYQRTRTSPGLAGVPESGSFVGSGDAPSDAAAPSDAVALPDAAADASDDGARDAAPGADAAGDDEGGDAPVHAATTMSTTASRGAFRSCVARRGGPERLAGGLADGRIEILLLSVLVRRARPARPDDDPFHVIARAIAPDICPPEFDRGAVGRRRDAFDEERWRAPVPAQQPCLAGAEEDRLESLAGPRDVHAVSRRQDLVEGV